MALYSEVIVVVGGVESVSSSGKERKQDKMVKNSWGGEKIEKNTSLCRSSVGGK